MNQPCIHFADDNRMLMYVSDCLSLIDDPDGRLASRFAQAAMRAASNEFESEYGRRPSIGELVKTPIVTAWNKDMGARG